MGGPQVVEGKDGKTGIRLASPAERQGGRQPTESLHELSLSLTPRFNFSVLALALLPHSRGRN
jgi:hypothetical protein